MLNVLDILIVASVCLFVFWRRLKPIRDFAAKIPGLDGVPFFGNSLSFIGVHPDDMYLLGYKMSKAFVSNCKFWLGPYLILVVKDPKDVKIVFNSDKCSDKPTFIYNVYSFFGMFVLTGDTHKQHRKSLMPLLYPTSLRSFLPIMNAKTKSFLKNFDSKLSANAIDFSMNSMDFALETSLLTLFKIDDIAEDDRIELINNMKSLQNIKTEILYKIWLRLGPIFRLSKIYKPYMERQQSIYKIIERVIEPMEKKYREIGNLPAVHKDPTYLDTFYTFRSKMITDEVLNLVLFFIYAIYDTSGKAIAAVLLLLAMNPEEQEKVLEEVKQLVASEDTEPDDECIGKMEYLDLVIKESMRLIPAALNLSRQVKGDVELTNYKVPSGTFIVLPILEIHRDKNHWGEDADEFKPERFRSENIKNVHLYSFVPFSRGPRMCPGNRYSLIMIKAFLSKFLMKYRVTTELKYEDLYFVSEMTTTIKQGFMVKVEKRK